jgi:hypothetical protein
MDAALGFSGGSLSAMGFDQCVRVGKPIIPDLKASIARQLAQGTPALSSQVWRALVWVVVSLHPQLFVS